MLMFAQQLEAAPTNTTSVIRTILHPMISGCRNFEFHNIIVAKFYIFGLTVSTKSTASFCIYICINRFCMYTKYC